MNGSINVYNLDIFTYIYLLYIRTVHYITGVGTRQE